jgi:hypothetical protein
MNHEDFEAQMLEDYHGWWVKQLSKRHRLRPIDTDRRLVADPGLFP